MGFSLQSLKKPVRIGEVVRTIKHDSGLELTLVVKHDPAFNSAFAKAQQLLAAKTTKDSFKRENQSDITGYEALIMVIGEYLVSDWNVDVNGVAVQPNGDNLLLVCENISSGLEKFLTQLFETVTSMIKEFSDTTEDAKKKPLSTTGGKRKP